VDRGKKDRLKIQQKISFYPNPFQIVDYGLAMKSDNGILVTKHLAFILRINLMFKQKNAYCVAMFTHMLLLLHARKHKLPAWQMYAKSASVFNEEVGEISLSVLGRVTLGDTLKSDFEYMSKMYSLQHQYRAVADDIRVGEGRKKRQPGGYTKLAKREVAQTKVTNFMLAMIVDVEAGTYRAYTGNLKKDNPAYSKDAVASDETRKERQNHMGYWLFHSSNEREIAKSLEKLRLIAVKNYCQNWGLKIKEVWPEFKAIPPHIRAMALKRAQPEIDALRARQAARARDLENDAGDGSEESGEESTEPEVDEALLDSDGDIEELVMEDSEAHRISLGFEEDLPVEKKRGRPKGS
jgi:hypothetical protein